MREDLAWDAGRRHRQFRLWRFQQAPGWRVARGLRLALLAALLAVLAQSASAFAQPACTRTWTGAAGGGLWTTAGNWSPPGVPGVADVICISTGSVTSPTGYFTIAALNLSGGALTLNGTLTTTGALNWSGGTLQGPVGSSATANGGLNISGAGTKTLGQVAVFNGGNGSWTGTGLFNTGNGAAVYNLAGATLTDGADGSSHTMQWGFGGPPTFFSNFGTYAKVGTGTTNLGVAPVSYINFNSTGTLNVSAGILNLNTMVAAAAALSTRPVVPHCSSRVARTHSTPERASAARAWSALH